MILIADSGSSKTDWRLLARGRVTGEFRTSGLNPLFHDTASILHELQQNPGLTEHRLDVKAVHFFGAGCSEREQQEQLSDVFKKFFLRAAIQVDSDLMAAAVAACGNSAGISCILGTGSNACFYDGKKILPNNFGLGYVLADEGAGTFIGKKLLTSFMYGRLPADLQAAFERQYKITRDTLIDHLYRQPNPNQWLASHALFATERKVHPWIQKLVQSGFKEFLELYVCSFPDYKILPAHFTGSIAFQFQELLREACASMNIHTGKILQRPIDGLTDHYLEKK